MKAFAGPPNLLVAKLSRSECLAPMAPYWLPNCTGFAQLRRSRLWSTCMGGLGLLVTIRLWTRLYEVWSAALGGRFHGFWRMGGWTKLVVRSMCG
jgi:hypothetical protein